MQKKSNEETKFQNGQDNDTNEDNITNNEDKASNENNNYHEGRDSKRNNIHDNTNTSDNTSYSHTNGTSGTDKRGEVESGSNKDCNEEEKSGHQKNLDHKDELRLFNVVFAVPASTSSQTANRCISILPLLH